MKKLIFCSVLVLLASCGAPRKTENPYYSNGAGNATSTSSSDEPMGTQGALGEANIACIERDGMLVGRRGGGVICKLPNGDIVDQMTLL